MINRVLALILLLTISPLFLLISLSVLIEDGFPVLFLQKRVGINYTSFNMYKFRSMKNMTPELPTHILSNLDRYILKVGKFLRKTSLDE